MDLVFVVRVVQHAVEVDLVDLRDRRDVAGHRRRDLDRLASLQHEQMSDLERLAAIADEKLRVLGHRALVYAEHTELADVRIDDDLEYVGQHVLLWIGLGAELLDRLAIDHLALVEERGIAFGRIRQQALEHLDQFVDAGAIFGGDETHRNQVAITQRLFERRVQLFGLDRLALFEVLGHEFLVDLDHLVDQRLVCFGHRGESRPRRPG